MTARLSIAAQPGQPALSAQQKKFNSLIRKIESQRKLLADWQEAIPLYQQRRASEFEPLLGTYRALNIELAHSWTRPSAGRDWARPTGRPCGDSSATWPRA